MTTAIQTLLDRLEDVTREGNRWMARCPHHKPDKKPSLSIGIGDNGKPLIKCFAGCKTVDILDDLGLTWPDLIGDNGRTATTTVSTRKRQSQAYPTIDAAVVALQLASELQEARVTHYRYTDTFVVIRFDFDDGKTFRPIHRTDGGWRFGDPDGLLPLYRVDELPPTGTAFPVEGEKDCEAARALGLHAVTSAHGSKSAAKSDWSPLQGRNVVIIADADRSGAEYAETVAGLLGDLDCSIRVIDRLPGIDAGTGGSVSDYIDCHDSRETEDLRRMIETIADESPEWKPATPEAEPTATAPATKDDRPHLEVITLDDVEPEAVEWLWPGRIAIGKITLSCGNAGLGKSFLTIDISARVSRGEPWPDRRGEPNPVGDVILLNAEDGVADTIVPRLKNAQADLTRVHVITGVRHPEDPVNLSLVNLDRDIRHIDEALGQYPEARLVVIDPLTAYLGNTDSHKDGPVRGVLAPLATMAERRRVAVVTVMHLNKASTMSALHRASGSVAFVAAARAAWVVCTDKDDPTRRLFLQLKNNLAPDPGGLAFVISHPGVVLWDAAPVTISADEALSPAKPKARTARDAAVDVLREILADGPVPAKGDGGVYDLADQAGISKRTLERAKAELGVIARRRKVDNNWRYEWELSQEVG